MRSGVERSVATNEQTDRDGEVGTVHDPIHDPIDRPGALRARYRLERAKRLRPDGNDQYLQPTGRFAHFLDDPYTEAVVRAPLLTTKSRWPSSGAGSRG